MDPFNSMVQNLVNNSSSLAHAPQVNTSSGLGYTDPGHGFMTNASVFDFDSDSKGAEGSEDPSDSAPRRSAKRTRAAEVHNMSEKRRRSRINEKMKALQKLIPNSNKTDKASMLDEAIEYLKQLQLQVQEFTFTNYDSGYCKWLSEFITYKIPKILKMLSMRNGVSLYPYCSPGPEPGIAALEHGLLTSRGDVFSLSTDTFNQCPQSTQPNLLFPLTETSIRPNFQTLNQLASSKDICQLSQLHLDMKCSGKNSTSGVSS